MFIYLLWSNTLLHLINHRKSSLRNVKWKFRSFLSKAGTFSPSIYEQHQKRHLFYCYAETGRLKDCTRTSLKKYHHQEQTHHRRIRAIKPKTNTTSVQNVNKRQEKRKSKQRSARIDTLSLCGYTSPLLLFLSSRFEDHVKKRVMKELRKGPCLGKTIFN